MMLPVGCSDEDGGSESTTTVAATGAAAPTATIEVPPTEVPPTPEPTSAVGEPTPELIRGQLSVTASGPCDEPFTLSGSGFDADRIAVYRLQPFEGSRQITEVDADASGAFELQLVADDLDDCGPGWVFVFSAGPEETASRTLAHWPRAVYEVEPPGDFRLTPSSMQCDDMQITAQLTGNGFPPTANVQVLLGGAEPFADNFVQLGHYMADANGALDVAVMLLGLACDSEMPRTMAVFGFVEGLDARWKALYDIVP